MTCEMRQLVNDAEDVMRRIGRGIEACVCLSVSESGNLQAALAYVADNLQGDFDELKALWERTHELTR